MQHSLLHRSAVIAVGIGGLLLVLFGGRGNAQTLPQEDPSPATRPAADHAEPPMKSLGRSFRYGVCSHLSRAKGADYDRLIELIDQLGIDIVRDGEDWNSLESQEGTWQFRPLDHMVYALANHGVELQTILGFSPKWAATGNVRAADWNEWNKSAPRVDPFKTFAETIVDRYKGRIRYWEIWNEPDISFWRSPTATYIEAFNQLSAAVAKTNPDAKVINGGFAMVRRPPNPSFVEDFLREADLAHWNVWAYHDYHTFPQMLSRFQETRALMQRTGAKMPLWVNEGGFHTLLHGGEAEQAITLVKKLAAAPSLGISAYFWYDLYDDGSDAKDPEHHFGLVHHDFTPKPSFMAYQTLIAELGQRTFARKLPEQPEIPGLWGMIYGGSKTKPEHVAVLWREGKGRSTPLWLGTEDGGAIGAVTDLFGKPVPSAAWGNGKAVSVTDSPVYVHLTGSDRLVVKTLLTLPDKLALLPGEDATLPVTIANPTPTAMRLTMSAEADSSALTVVDRSAGELNVTAGGSVRSALKLRWSGTDGAPTTGRVAVRLRGNSPGDAVIEAQVPYQAATRVPKLADAAPALADGQGLTFKLDDPSFLTNLFSAEPNDAMHWHGPADLSATGQIAYTAQGLLLRVVATDDVHAQKYPAAQLWRGDCLQVGIKAGDSRSDYLELTLAVGDDGVAHGWVYAAPADSGLKADTAVGEPIAFSVTRKQTTTEYLARISWKCIGVATPPAQGLRFNFLVNDDDGAGRKQWMQLSDGIGGEKNADLFRLFVCE